MKRSRPTTLEPISAAMIVMISLHLAAALGITWWWKDYSARKSHSKEPPLAWMNPRDFKTTALEESSSVPKATLVAAPPRTARPVEPAVKTTPEPPVQKATLIAAPPQSTQMEPVKNATSTPLFAPPTAAVKPAANRSITLRRVPDKPVADTTGNYPAPPMTSPTLLDIARLNTLRPAPLPPPTAANADDSVNMDAVDEAVNSAFLAGWVAPPLSDVPSNQRGACMHITIGKNGAVVKSQMSKFSGSHVLDQSILEAAATVKKISATLPSAYSKESYDLELNFLLLP